MTRAFTLGPRKGAQQRDCSGSSSGFASHDSMLGASSPLGQYTTPDSSNKYLLLLLLYSFPPSRKIEEQEEETRDYDDATLDDANELFLGWKYQIVFFLLFLFSCWADQLIFCAQRAQLQFADKRVTSFKLIVNCDIARIQKKKKFLDDVKEKSRFFFKYLLSIKQQREREKKRGEEDRPTDRLQCIIIEERRKKGATHIRSMRCSSTWNDI